MSQELKKQQQINDKQNNLIKNQVKSYFEFFLFFCFLIT